MTSLRRPWRMVVTPAGVTLLIPLLLAITPFRLGAMAASPPPAVHLLPAPLQPLVRELQARGFRIRLAPPPIPQAYGLYQASSRTLWLSPLTFDLGIARQTFLHEAVHAVQSCPRGTLTPIGWSFRLSPVVEQEINGILTTRYHHGNRLLEQEAFGLQGQADAVPRLLEQLRRRCRR